MNILIIEDEPLAASRLEKLILQYEPHIQILDKIDSVEDTVEWLQTHPHPDLCFMDIQLADGLSFGIFDKIKLQSPVIFTTAFDEYAIRAFKVNSIDYLLKPLDFESVANALDKYASLHLNTPKPTGMSPEVLEQVLQQFQKPDYKSRFVVKRGDKLVSVKATDICYFWSEDKATLIRTNAGKKYVVDYTLSELEELLSPEHFFRIGRAYIVQIDAVEEIVAYSASRLSLTLTQGHESAVLVSKQRVGAFRAWLDQ